MLAGLQAAGLGVSGVAIAQGQLGYWDARGAFVECCCDAAQCPACYACAPIQEAPDSFAINAWQLAGFVGALLAALLCVGASKHSFDKRRALHPPPEQDVAAEAGADARAGPGEAGERSGRGKYGMRRSQAEERASVAVEAMPVHTDHRTRTVDEITAVRRKARLAWGDFDDV